PAPPWAGRGGGGGGPCLLGAASGRWPPGVGRHRVGRWPFPLAIASGLWPSNPSPWVGRHRWAGRWPSPLAPAWERSVSDQLLPAARLSWSCRLDRWLTPQTGEGCRFFLR